MCPQPLGSPSSLRQVNADKDRTLLLDWDRVRVFDREIAQMFLNLTKQEKEAKVCPCCPHLSHWPGGWAWKPQVGGGVRDPAPQAFLPHPFYQKYPPPGEEWLLTHTPGRFPPDAVAVGYICPVCPRYVHNCDLPGPSHEAPVDTCHHCPFSVLLKASSCRGTSAC